MLRELLTAFGFSIALTLGSGAIDASFAQSVDTAELLKPGPLEEKAFGSPSAPVTIIEYASLTCPHCRRFHVETWAAFREKYVDTGKVRFIMREFPLDQLATAGAMLARCAGDELWYPVTDMLYQTQESWARSGKPLETLSRSLQMAGVSRSEFNACLKDETLFQSIGKVRERAASQFGVDGTPTFFINGQKKVGALSLDEFSAVVDPLLR